jgi:hypothetical protein
LPQSARRHYDPSGIRIVQLLDVREGQRVTNRHNPIARNGGSWLAAVLYVLIAGSIATPDTLVVCPTEFQSALLPWQELRQRQGHRILVVPPAGTAAQLLSTIRQIGASQQLKFLVLIGDVPDHHVGTAGNRGNSIPTNYAPAAVNTRWGSEPSIATDSSYADLDGDHLPDVAVGRIPAASVNQLAAVVRKILRYEEPAPHAAANEKLQVVAGLGGFGALTDALLEAAVQQVFRQTLPPTCLVEQASANPTSPHFAPPDELRAIVRRQLCGSSLAWIYMGHALPTELHSASTARGQQPILSVRDVPHLRGAPHSPLAVLVACYAGAVDSRPNCLAEELVLAEEGPIAVIAATRVTMPYGNTVLGYELLRACFGDRPNTLGSILLLAQRRSLTNVTGDTLRSSLDMLAQGLSPPPVDLEAERREHVMMYHLFGDPLVRFHIAVGKVARADSQASSLK